MASHRAVHGLSGESRWVRNRTILRLALLATTHARTIVLDERVNSVTLG